MSTNDSITDLATDTLTVNRYAEGTYTDGIYTQSSPTSFTIVAVVQPAFNLNRVIGGANLGAHVDNQQATEVRQLWTTTQLKTRTPTTDPDIIVGYEGASWTVARVEEWWMAGDEVHYHCVISKITEGAS